MISVILSLVTAVWFLLALFLSHQGGAETYETSIGIAEFLYRFLEDIGLGDAFTLEMLNLLLRRAAHIILFFVLTLLVCLTLLVLQQERSARVNPLIGFFFCLFCCWADEATKILIDGRHFAWFDVGLNAAGCAAGGLAFVLIGRFLPSLLRRHPGKT